MKGKYLIIEDGGREYREERKISNELEGRINVNKQRNKDKKNNSHKEETIFILRERKKNEN